MKTIYSFKLTKKIPAQITESQTNDKGETVQVIKSVDKDEIHTYILKRPTRSLSDSAELFRAKSESVLLKDGILSANQLNRRINDDGGLLSVQEKEQENKLYKDLYDNQEIYTKLNSKKDEEKSAEDKVEIQRLLDIMVGIMKEIQKFQDAKNSVFNRTAENIANNYCIFWWYINLSYEEIGPNKFKPVFGEGNYETKLAIYDQMEEAENDFEYQVLKKLFLITNLWYTGKAEKPEDFDILLKLAAESGLSDKIEEPKVEQKVEIKEEVKPTEPISTESAPKEILAPV